MQVYMHSHAKQSQSWQKSSPFGHITYSKVEFSFIFSEKHRLRPDFFIYLINLNCFGGIFAGKGEKKTTT